jgi:hypothetical protein
LNAFSLKVKDCSSIQAAMSEQNEGINHLSSRVEKTLELLQHLNEQVQRVREESSEVNRSGIINTDIVRKTLKENTISEESLQSSCYIEGKGDDTTNNVRLIIRKKGSIVDFFYRWYKGSPPLRELKDFGYDSNLRSDWQKASRVIPKLINFLPENTRFMPRKHEFWEKFHKVYSIQMKENIVMFLKRDDVKETIGKELYGSGRDTVMKRLDYFATVKKLIKVLHLIEPNESIVIDEEEDIALHDEGGMELDFVPPSHVLEELQDEVKECKDLVIESNDVEASNNTFLTIPSFVSSWFK